MSEFAGVSLGEALRHRRRPVIVVASTVFALTLACVAIWFFALQGGNGPDARGDGETSTTNPPQESGSEADTNDQVGVDQSPLVSNVPLGEGEQVSTEEAAGLETALAETDPGLSEKEVAEVESRLEEFETQQDEALVADEADLDEAVAAFLEETSAPESSDAEDADDDAGTSVAPDDAVADLAKAADARRDALQQLTDDVTAEATP